MQVRSETGQPGTRPAFSATLALLISDNTEVNFSDNFFDRLPGEVRTVSCPKTIRWEDFEKGFPHPAPAFGSLLWSQAFRQEEGLKLSSVFK